MSITLDRVAFTAWLATLPQTELFARAFDSTCCPIAEYLKTDPQVSYVYAGQFRLEINGEGWIATPLWAAYFMTTLDETYRDVYSITPEQALAVLATIPSEVAA